MSHETKVEVFIYFMLNIYMNEKFELDFEKLCVICFKVPFNPYLFQSLPTFSNKG